MYTLGFKNRKPGNALWEKELQNMEPHSNMGEKLKARCQSKRWNHMWPRAGDSMNLVNRFSIFFEVSWHLENMYDVRSIQYIAD